MEDPREQVVQVDEKENTEDRIIFVYGPNMSVTIVRDWDNKPLARCINDESLFAALRLLGGKSC